MQRDSIVTVIVYRGGGTCDDLGGGAKLNGQPGIVDTFLNFHVAMHNVSTPRLSKKKYIMQVTQEKLIIST